MRYAVISDIHSNLESLTAFFEEIKTLDIGKTVCLGDVVGYNANPNECVELIRKNKIQCVMGNHDSRATGIEPVADFNLLAAHAARWTMDALTPENAEFLKTLPRSITVDKKFLAIHGWVDNTDSYIMGIRDAERNFELMRAMDKPVNLCFFGHTHVPLAYVEADGVIGSAAGAPVKIEKGASYLINPGSLGQPRDRDPRASFAVFDAKKSLVTFHRFEYDVHATAEKILAAGLPERLAERLKLGW
ncbi:MAG: metallophosphoesterase family protein [Deltaproteobacteria bacterium]|nr:metallophosphoesterase family protein [Deltaproteobacteria bacterium]